jgi:hypothetical protein
MRLATPRIFELFVQADPRRIGRPGGLGIGLAVVRSLVELHSGRVEAASDGPGRGGVFSAAPAVDPPASAAATASSDGGAAAPAGRQASGGTPSARAIPLTISTSAGASGMPSRRRRASFSASGSPAT